MKTINFKIISCDECPLCKWDNFQLGEIRGLERAREMLLKLINRNVIDDYSFMDLANKLAIEINKIKNSNTYKPMFDEPKELNLFGE